MTLWQISLRIPPSLHKLLADIAAVEDISLNQFMTMALARAAGFHLETARQQGDKVTVAERKAKYTARAKSKKAFSNKRRGKHVDLPTDASIGQT